MMMEQERGERHVTHSIRRILLARMLYYITSQQKTAVGTHGGKTITPTGSGSGSEN